MTSSVTPSSVSLVFHRNHLNIIILPSLTFHPYLTSAVLSLPPSLPQLGSRGVVRRLKQTGFNQRVLPQHRSSRQKEPSPGEQPAIKDCCTPLPDPYHNNTTSRNNYLFLLMWGFEVIPPSFFSTPYQTSHSLTLSLSISLIFPSLSLRVCGFFKH